MNDKGELVFDNSRLDFRRVVREGMGLTVRQLAEVANVRVSDIVKLEHGDKRIPLRAWSRICSVLRIGLDMDDHGFYLYHLYESRQALRQA